MAYADYVRNDEKKIIDKIIMKALAKGYIVSVGDGLTWTSSLSRDYETITAAVAATDVTKLRFRDKMTVLGEVILIHGNGEDVIHDHSDNEVMEELCAA